MKVVLSLTHRCNLSCAYCYSGRAFNKDMSFITAQKIVDFVMNITPAQRAIELSFFGGEPLLCLALMKDIVSYIREQERDRKPTRLSITTNGVLLTQSILNFFKKENVNLCISIDGPAHVHNLNRCYKDGRASFEDVERNLKKATEELENVQVNAVYGPETIDNLPESVAFFTELGVPIIHLNPNICASWPRDTYSKVRETYMQIANYYIQSYRQGQEIAVNLIDSKIIVLLKGGYGVEDRCGMGETEWGFAPSGNIYPCERFIGEDKNTHLCLGNIHTGLELARRRSLLEHRGNRNEECKACYLQKYCMNWCGCTNYYMTRHTDLAGPMLCESEKAAIQAAKLVLIALKDDELFLDHFMDYLQEGIYEERHYQ